MQVDLTMQDRKFLKKELLQVFVIYSFVLMAVLVVYCIPFAFIQNLPIDPTTKNTSLILFTVLVLSLYAFSFWKKLRNPLADIRSGKKQVINMLLLDKQDFTHYAYSGNIIVNLRNQPRLTEYKFIFEDRTLYVEKEAYEKYERGEVLTLHFSLFTDKLIQIEYPSLV